MRLSDREPRKLTKTVRETVLSGGMVSCGVVSCGVVSCGVVGCGQFFPIPSLSSIFWGQKLSLNIFSYYLVYFLSN